MMTKRDEAVETTVYLQRDKYIFPSAPDIGDVFTMANGDKIIVCQVSPEFFCELYIVVNDD